MAGRVDDRAYEGYDAMSVTGDWASGWARSRPRALPPACFDPRAQVHFDDAWNAWHVYDLPDLRRVVDPDVGAVDVSDWAADGNPSFAAPWALDGPAWRDLRSLIEPPYRADRVRSLAPDLAAAARRCLGRALALRPEGLEVVGDFAQPFAIVAAGLSMGVLETETDVDRLAGWLAETSAAQTAGTFAVPADAVEYFRTLIGERTGAPRHGLLDDLIATRTRGGYVGGESLRDWQILGVLWSHIIDSADTLATQLGTTVFALMVHGMLDEVRGDRSLVPNAVEAALWWNPAFPYVRRRLRVPATLGGVRVPAGSDVVGWLSAAGRARFAGPFGIHGARLGHIGFGLAPRVCVGAALSRQAIGAGLNALLDALPHTARVAAEPRYELVLNNSLRELRLEFRAIGERHVSAGPSRGDPP